MSGSHRGKQTLKKVQLVVLVLLAAASVYWFTRSHRKAGVTAVASTEPASASSPATMQATPTAPAVQGPLQFVDVTEQAGIHFEHNTGGFGQDYLPETLGSGNAWIDYDNDGYQDILLLSGRDWPGHPTRLGNQCSLRLYHNNHNGTFTDVTRKAGLCVKTYAMGVAVGDYNNDGFDDLYITSLDGNLLFKNNGNGTFTDVTKKAGVGEKNFGTSAAWVDYDKDGKLDLFVDNYVQWSPQTDIRCSLDGVHRSYCTPEAYTGTSPRLYHNNGDGTFTDVTKQAGIYDPTSKSLGITVVDYNNDGWPDLFVSNDTQPNKLYRNNGNGTFTEEAVPAGIAYSEDGVARGGMGTDAADYDGSGRFSIVIGNFANQMLGLYQNQGHGLFVDQAPSSEIGRASQLSLTFGAFFFDYNLDGKPDLFIANGHLDPRINQVQPRVHYAEAPLLFENAGGGRFHNASDSVGSALQHPIVARGAAYGDFNLDGNLDVLITTNNGPAYLYKNTGSGNFALRIRTVGVKSNRDGIGTLVRVHTGQGWEEKLVKSGSSYASSSELPLTFGLGKNAEADSVALTWPSGIRQTLHHVSAGQFITVTEGKGITHTQALNQN